MNVFSRVKNALAQLLSRREQNINTHRREAPRPRFNPVQDRQILVYHNNGRPIFGPATVPDKAWHWLTRQACRHYLRAIAFQSISQQAPLMSRRDRRRWARAAAGIEYYDMMRDTTNLVGNEAELTA